MKRAIGWAISWDGVGCSRTTDDANLRLAAIRRDLAERLLRDAKLQSHAPELIGRDFDEVDVRCPRADRILNIALAFWVSWIDERNRGFPGIYAGIGKDDWPGLSEHLAKALIGAAEPEEPSVLKYFTPRAPAKGSP